MKLLKGNFLVYLLGLFVILVAAVGCDDSDSGTTPNNERGENEVWMQSIAFVPDNLTVSVGTTVTWVNKDAVIHTVTSGTPGNPTGRFDSGNMNNGDTFTFTFNSAGTYEYYCRLHPTQMTATIIVR